MRTNRGYVTETQRSLKKIFARAVSSLLPAHKREEWNALPSTNSCEEIDQHSPECTCSQEHTFYRCTREPSHHASKDENEYENNK